MKACPECGSDLVRSVITEGPICPSCRYEPPKIDRTLHGIPDDGEPLTYRPGEYLAQPRQPASFTEAVMTEIITAGTRDADAHDRVLLEEGRGAVVEFTPSRSPRSGGTMTHLSLKYVEERLHALAARLTANLHGTNAADSASIADELTRHGEYLSGFGKDVQINQATEREPQGDHADPPSSPPEVLTDEERTDKPHPKKSKK